MSVDREAGEARGLAISIVVATRDRPAALERCLIALASQRAPSLELVVVDDGSADPAAVDAAVDAALRAATPAPTRSAVQVDAALRAATPAPTRSAVQVVRGTGRGPAAARNLGARAATGAIVLFIDDDCVVGPHWAQTLAAACPEGGAAAGVTVADPAAGRAAAVSQLLTHTLQLASLDPATGRLGFAPTCNLACRADVLRRMPFDESFPLAAGEDRDWCSRLAAHGVALRFVPGARVEHRPRMGLVGLLRQQLRYGRGAVRYRGAGADIGRADRAGAADRAADRAGAADRAADRAGDAGRIGDPDRVDRVGDAAVRVVDRRLSGRAFYGRLARAAVQAGPAAVALVALAQAAVAAGALAEALASRQQ